MAGVGSPESEVRAVGQGLTVLIPCRNEERNVRPCIESVRAIADEVLVADSGSTDRTMGIARELGAGIIEREYVNPGDFKNWAIPQAAHEWVLLLDADERATAGLASEIEKLLAAGPDRDGYWIRRRGHFFGHEIRHSGWQSDKVLRLVRRDVARYSDKTVHEEMVIATGKVGRLRGRLEHYTYWTFGQYFEKFGRYTTWAAEDLKRKGRRAGLLSLTVRPAWRFFRQYVLRLGFLDGLPGLVLCMLAAFSVFTKYAKLWAMDHGRPREGQRRKQGYTGWT